MYIQAYLDKATIPLYLGKVDMEFLLITLSFFQKENLDYLLNFSWLFVAFI